MLFQYGPFDYSGPIKNDAKRTLRTTYDQLNPVELKRRIGACQDRLRLDQATTEGGAKTTRSPLQGDLLLETGFFEDISGEATGEGFEDILR